MKQGPIRRAVAAASATAMAGAALVVGGAGAASAEPATVTGELQRGGSIFDWDRWMSYERSVSNGTPTHGETVTVTTKVIDDGGTWAGNLYYWVEDRHPECFEYVEGSARWMVSGNEYTQATRPDEVEVSPGAVRIDAWGANSWDPPVELTTEYVVNCHAGETPNGGLAWNATLGASNDDLGEVGPAVMVQRATVEDFFLRVPSSAEVGETSILSVRTDAPEGSNVTFAVDGETLSGTVVDGEATAEWTPQAPGQRQVTATFGRTPTHNGKTDSRTVNVAEQVVDASVQLTVPSDAQYGVESELSATVTPDAAAGGTVEFLEDGKVVASGVVPADGVVTVDWTPSAEGNVSIDARYLGGDGVRPAQAIGQSVTVAPAEEGKVDSTTSLDAVAMTQVGETVTLRATVSPQDTGGQVAFYDGSERLGAADVNSEGVATFEWTPATAGASTVRAAFSGTDTVLASQATTSVTITSATDLPEPDPEVPGPADPDTGSLGSLTDSLGGGAGGPLSSLGS